MSRPQKQFWFWAWILLGGIRKEDRRNPKSRCEVWENLILVRASNAAQALAKAEQIGRAESGDSQGTLTLDGKPATQIFLGLSNIGLVHEEISDGVEITWNLKRTFWKKAKLLARSRKTLLSDLEQEFRPYKR